MKLALAYYVSLKYLNIQVSKNLRISKLVAKYDDGVFRQNRSKVCDVACVACDCLNLADSLF